MRAVTLKPNGVPAVTLAGSVTLKWFAEHAPAMVTAGCDPTILKLPDVAVVHTLEPSVQGAVAVNARLTDWPAAI